MGKPRALIIGGSLGGLFSAHLLRAVGWDVIVFEQESGDLAGRGAGIGTHEALLQVMGRIGMPLEKPMSVETRSYVCLSPAGSIVREVPSPRTMSAWACFYRPLKHHLPAECCHFGMRLQRVVLEHDGITALFADGSRVRGDMLIGADGHRPTVRSQFLPDVRPAYAGYVAWRAIVPKTGFATRPANCCLGDMCSASQMTNWLLPIRFRNTRELCPRVGAATMWCGIGQPT